MKTLKIPILLLGVLLLAACQSDDTDFGSLIYNEENIEVKDIQPNESPLEESERVPVGDNDYVENSDFDHVVYITYDGDGVTLTGETSRISYTVDGAHVVVRAQKSGMEYVLSGRTANGGLKIYSEKKYKLTLAGVDITNPKGAAINNQCGKSLYVVLGSGTVNRLEDGTSYDTPALEDEKGAFFSEGQMLFSGAGTLHVTGHYRNGIASDDYILFRPGNIINVTTDANNGVKANDGVDIRGGVLNIQTTGNGAKGINSEAYVNVSGGRTTIINAGESRIEGTDTTTCAAVKTDSTFTMTAGTLRLKATGAAGKGINAAMAVTVMGGTLDVVTLGAKVNGSPKGIKSDADITLGGGTIYVYSKAAVAVEAAGTLIVKEGYTVWHAGRHLFELSY